MKPPSSLACIIAASLLVLTTESKAALLLYEGFDGYSAGSLIGQSVNANAFGISGAYSGSNFNYNSTGLSFGTLSVSGGAAQSNSSQFTSLTASIAPGTSATGDLWMSYLFSNSSIGGNVRTTISGDMRTASVLGGASNKPGVSYSGASYATSPGSAVSENTTYMMIAKWTNVGNALTPTSPGAARFWVLDLAQYNNFALAGYSESYLTSASIGTGANDVFGKLSSPLFQTSGSFVFDNTRTLNLEVVNAFAAETFDEIRIGTTLADVAVPEPQTAMMLIASAVACTFFRKRCRV